jgi:hypothetical protein
VAAVLVLVEWSWPPSGVAAPVAGGAAFSGSVVEFPLGVGSTWLAHAAASPVVGMARDSVGFLLGSGVALTRGDVRSEASLAVVDGGCCGIVKVWVASVCGLRCGGAAPLARRCWCWCAVVVVVSLCSSSSSGRSISVLGAPFRPVGASL